MPPTARARAGIGISAVAADALGDVVYVDLPEVGSTVTAGETCGELESTKSVSDLYAPVTGEVTEINDDVVDDPALINSDPYGAGWLFKVAVDRRGPAALRRRVRAKQRRRTVSARRTARPRSSRSSPEPGRGPVRAGPGDRRAVDAELNRQQPRLEMIASENHSASRSWRRRARC